MSNERPRPPLLERVKAPAEGIVNTFVERRVAKETEVLQKINHERGLSEEDQAEIMRVARDAYVFHFGERRVTGGSYFGHPAAVAEEIAKNHYIPLDELKDHEIMALGHDLPENTNITRVQLIRRIESAPAIKGILLLSRFHKSEGGTQQSRADNMRDILESGDIKAMRVKIEDWGHNLVTTPATTDGYRGRKKRKIIKFQQKFHETSEYILPLIRYIGMHNPEEAEYLYQKMYDVHLNHRPPGTPDLEPLAPAA